MPKLDLIDRNEVIAMFPNMTLRKFKRTRLYFLLKIHARQVTKKTVYYPRPQVMQALKIEGYVS